MTSIEEYADKLDALITEIRAAGYVVTLPPRSMYERATQATIGFEEEWDGSKFKVIKIE